MNELAHDTNSQYGGVAMMGKRPDIAPTDDPLWCKVALKCRATFYPLGFALEVCSNEPRILELFERCWGGLRALHETPPLQARIIVTPGVYAACPPTPVIRAQKGMLVTVADAHHYSIADLHHGACSVWLTDSALHYPEYLEYHFIVPIRVLVATSFTTPLHAACLSRCGHGILLSGESGAGKSTLAYACARAGWAFTADDGSFLLRGSGQPRVVGDCHMIRFRPEARDLFPELAGYDLTPRIQGKPSIEIPTSSLGVAVAEQGTVQSIIFLNRQPMDGAELLPMSPQRSLEYFRASLSSYPEGEYRQGWNDSLQNLVHSTRIFELRCRDLPAAIECLGQLAEGRRYCS